MSAKTNPFQQGEPIGNAGRLNKSDLEKWAREADYRVALLAKKAGLSLCQFERYFLKEFGQTPSSG